MSAYDIEWINDRTPNINYEDRAFDTDFGEEHYTRLFEGRLAKKVKDYTADDIGGLIVYSKDSEVVAVYDYENYCGWWA